MNRLVRLPTIGVALIAAAPVIASGAEAQSFAAPPGAAQAPAYRVGGTATPARPVSMRAGPSTDDPVIGTLRPGMPLQILASANYGWMQVQSPLGTGWVYGSYLAIGGGGPAPVSAAQPKPQPKPEITSP